MRRRRTDDLPDGTPLVGVENDAWGFLARRCETKKVRVLRHDYPPLGDRVSELLFVGRMEQPASGVVVTSTP